MHKTLSSYNDQIIYLALASLQGFVYPLYVTLFLSSFMNMISAQLPPLVSFFLDLFSNVHGDTKSIHITLILTSERDFLLAKLYLLSLFV